MTMRQRPRMHSRYETSLLSRHGSAISVSLNLERLWYSCMGPDSYLVNSSRDVRDARCPGAMPDVRSPVLVLNGNQAMQSIQPQERDECILIAINQ